MPKNYCIMQIWAESGKSALPICNYSQILYQFLTFTQNLKRSLCFYIFTEKVHQYDAQCIITGGLFTSIYLSDEIFDYFSCFTVSKLPYCFCFYLANPFSCNAKFPSQFLKCPLFAIHEAKSVFYYFRFTFF